MQTLSKITKNKTLTLPGQTKNIIKMIKHIISSAQAVRNKKKKRNQQTLVLSGQTINKIHIIQHWLCPGRQR